MNPLQAPNTGPGRQLGRDFNRRFFRVTYEVPPTRAIRTANFEEFAASTSDIKKMVQDENPNWRIKDIERGIPQS